MLTISTFTAIITSKLASLAILTAQYTNLSVSWNTLKLSVVIECA